MDNQKEEKEVITKSDPFIVISPFSGRSLSLQDKLQIAAGDLMYYSIKLAENEVRKTEILDAIYGDTPKYRNAPVYISDALIKSLVFMELLIEKAEFTKYVDPSDAGLRFMIRHIRLDNEDGVFSFTVSVGLAHNDIDIIVPFNLTANVNLKRLYFKYKKNDYVEAGNTSFCLNINSKVLDCETCNNIKVINKPERAKEDEEVYYSDLITYEVKNAVMKLDKSLYSILHHVDTEDNSSRICESCKWIANTLNKCNPFYEVENTDYKEIVKFLEKAVDRYHRYYDTSTEEKDGIKFDTTSYYITSPETDILSIMYSDRFKSELYNVFTRMLGLIKDYSSLDEEYKKSIEQEVKDQDGTK